MKQRAWWWAWLAAAIGGGIGIAIGLALAGDDIDKVGDWRHGAARFVGMCGAFGVFAGYVIGSRLTRGEKLARDGFTISYRPLPPTAAGYRENHVLAVADVITALTRVGYEPRVEACDDFGERRGAIDAQTPLQGANLAISDAGVRGWVRIALAPLNQTQPRALGFVEIWSKGGNSVEELALFTLRVLDGLVADLKAARESSRLTPIPISLLTAGLGERPVHRVV